jgi:hypothetical protein
LPRLFLNHDSPVSSSWVVGIIGVHPHVWLATCSSKRTNVWTFGLQVGGLYPFPKCLFTGDCMPWTQVFPICGKSTKIVQCGLFDLESALYVRIIPPYHLLHQNT